VKLREVFLGKPVHWLPWPIIVATMVWMNSVHFHILRFNFFALALVGIAAAMVAFFLLTSRRGEQITREPFAEGQEVAGTGKED
jgi:hypothetical protein